MALPLILSVLGSTAAGAGMLGSLSPLIAGALGSGLGTAIQTGDIRQGLQAGLTSGILGGIGGMVAKNLGGAGAAAGTGAVGSLDAAAQSGQLLGAQQAAQQTAQPGIFSALTQNMQPGFTAGQAAAAGTPLSQQLMTGLGGAGAMSGAGIGTALGSAFGAPPQGLEAEEYKDIPQAAPANRERYEPPEGYRPGIDPEFTYFNPNPMPAVRFNRGGMVRYRPTGMDTTYRMAAGGLADMGGMGEMSAAPEPNDKQLVQMAIRAIRGEMPEQQAAMVLGKFLESFGEAAFRRLVKDVKSGEASGPRGDMEGTVEGPGDGMDDLVPATMDDGSQDVLLSDGEFIVPADVVSGLGNGSTDAGASELERMMSRVRSSRTGTTEQPAQVAAGGLLPA